MKSRTSPTVSGGKARRISTAVTRIVHTKIGMRMNVMPMARRQTIVILRALGMTFMRMPIFVWTILVTAVLILLAFPPLTVGLVLLFMDRFLGTRFYAATMGASPVLWQHLFWLFGHPEVYIMALPAFGIVSEVVPVFSRKPLYGYPMM